MTQCVTLNPFLRIVLKISDTCFPSLNEYSESENRSS